MGPGFESQRDHKKSFNHRLRLFLCPLGIRIIACSGKGCGHGGHAPQAFIMVRYGEGSRYVSGVCGAEPLPAGSDQENP